MKLEGIGPVTATAIVASVGDAKIFKNGRQFAAWLGLTPRQHSTGGRQRLGTMTKHGDVYLRTLLIHGTRAVLRVTPNASTPRAAGSSAYVTDDPTMSPPGPSPPSTPASSGHYLRATRITDPRPDPETHPRLEIATTQC
jgi:hypothetical protein